MKTIFNMKWMSLLLVAVLSLGFVSCGDDDEEDDKNQQSVTASIFGTWVEDDDDYVLTLTLNQDGTGIVVLYDKTTKRETRDPFEYSYDNSTKVLNVVGSGLTGSYDVVVTNSPLLLYFWEDNERWYYSFTRSK